MAKGLSGPFAKKILQNLIFYTNYFRISKKSITFALAKVERLDTRIAIRAKRK